MPQTNYNICETSSEELKLKEIDLIKYYIEDDLSIANAAKKVGEGPSWAKTILRDKGLLKPRHNGRKLHDKDIPECIRLKESGLKLREIADIYGVTAGTVSNWINRYKGAS